ncbi:MAG: PqqD family protein [Candidatus Omnitrophica bacterium]|nr:PqqD family protein [Candidatus Omnitrophota bacterium]
MTKKKYPVKSPDIVVREENGEALLFNPKDGKLICVNKTGIFIWKNCDGARSLEDIIKQLINKYDVPLSCAEKDCAKYFMELKQMGFIGEKV